MSLYAFYGILLISFYTQELMNTEYYAMRLVCKASLTDSDTWPEEIQEHGRNGCNFYGGNYEKN